MVRSIQSRLVISFIGLVILTLVVVGALTFTLIRQNIHQQEMTFMKANAEVLVDEAAQLLWPFVRQHELQSLVDTSSFLGNYRVQILDVEGNLLADSKSSDSGNQLVMLYVPVQDQEGNVDETLYQSLILSVPSEKLEDVEELEDYIEMELPDNPRLFVINRIYHPWGVRIEFTEQDLSEEAQVTQSIASENLSDQVYSMPIEKDNVVLGYVQLSEGPNFGSEALDATTNSFILAAFGAVFLAILFGVLVSRRMSSPIKNLSQVADQMGKGNLAVRVQEEGADEIGQLSIHFNRMADEVQQSFEELEEERDALRRFITDASHELRTPITALKNFNEILMDDKGRDAKLQEEFLSESQIQIQQLEWITKNLLNLSRLDAGLQSPKKELVEVMDLFQAVINAFQIRASEKGKEILVKDLPADLSVNIDRVLGMIALNNLVDNALKFIPENTGRVILSAEQIKDSVLIVVSDNGSGIDEKEQEFIFDRFYRGKNSNNEGSGLGLAMVKSIMEAHDGKVTFSSTSEGTNFRLVFPL